MNPFNPQKQAEAVANFSEAQLAQKAVFHGKWARRSPWMIAFAALFLATLDVLDVRSGGHFSMERFFAQLFPIAAILLHWVGHWQKAMFYAALWHARQGQDMTVETVTETKMEPEQDAELDMVPVVTENG